ncbi:MAG: ATP-binding protein [Ktedonobacteraceae bacterium]
MERLNDIMSRTGQRRQQPDPRLSGQRRPAPQPQPMRRPQPGQAQRGEQYQQQPPRQGQPSLGAPRAAASRARSEEPTSPIYPPRRGYRQPAYEDDAASPAVYQPRVTPQSLPAYPLAEQRRPERLTGDFYEGYLAAPDADVQEQWDEDSTGLVYGDWEGEESAEPPAYVQEERVVKSPRPLHDKSGGYGYQSTAGAFAAQNYAPLVTRQLPRMEEQEFETRPPAPRSPLTPPALERAQRMTQPLNPRNIARVSQGLPQPPTPSHEPPRIQQPARQVTIRTPQAQPLPPAPRPAYLSIPRPLPPKEVCPKCKGAGYLRLDVSVGHPCFGKLVPCECKEAEKKEKRRQELLELSDLGAFDTKVFGNFNRRFSGVHPSVEEAFQEAYAFAQEPRGWLLLIGPNGCGKTHLAAAIANDGLRNGSVVLFSVVPDLLAHLRATFSPSATEAYDQRFAKMREAELLVLDDLGAHQSSPWASEQLFQLLNYRYNSYFPTVITANRSGLGTIDERILSRLSDTALVTTVVLDGARDYRRQNPRHNP